MKRAFLLFLLTALSATPVFAEVLVKSVAWHVAPVGTKAYQPVDRWVLPPGPRTGKARAVVTIANRGPRAAEAVVLRYAVSARLAKIGEEGKEGIWAVPFWLEERRVPRVKPNQLREVPIDHMLLDRYLKKIHRTGFWLDALKIHVMVEPRAGEGFSQHVLEQTLPVTPR